MGDAVGRARSQWFVLHRSWAARVTNSESELDGASVNTSSDVCGQVSTI